MSKTAINPINDRIVNEILKGKADIKYQKDFIVAKNEEENEDLKGSFNKVTGNLTTMVLRNHISNIINYYGLNYKVSNANAFVKGCPIEWDLIIVKKTAQDINNTNVYNVEDCECLFEFKTSGLMPNQFKNIDKTFENQFKYLYHLRNEKSKIEPNTKPIPFGYVTFCESLDYYEPTRNYFNKNNGLSKEINTTFDFLDYYVLVRKDEKQYIEECNDFEKYLFDLLK